EYLTGLYYYKKGALPAAQGRFAFVAQQYPNYSQSDEALWDLADSYRKMGDRFENQEAGALTKIVRDYPASLHADAAKNMLTEMKRPVPQGDPAAYEREKYNLEHRTKEGFLSRVDGIITGHPDMGFAAKQGDPVMTAMRPGNPVSIPMEAASALNPTSPGTGATGVSDVGIGVAGNTSALDQKSDARINSQDEHKASVTSNGLSTDAAGQPHRPPHLCRR